MNRLINAETVTTRFTYHGVGQGLFYSGEIKCLKNGFNFRFVYDCGSEKLQLINSSIRIFRNNSQENEIDLLVISHLHSDHVSGLEELFDNFKIRNVALSYFSPVERLLIALRRINLPLWYYEFLADPVAYLVERGVERVIILGGGGRGFPPEDFFPSPPEDGSPNKLDIDKLPDDEELRGQIIKNDENWQDYLGKGKLLVKNHNGYALAIGLWMFRFFNCKIPLSTLYEFKKCLRAYGLVDNKSIKDAIRKRNQLRRLKECYHIIGKELRNDFNNVSLVLYHGPIGKCASDVRVSCYSRSPFWCNPFRTPYEMRILEKGDKIFGHLLTGDINLNTKRHYNELKQHYSVYLKDIIAVLIPHHGARRNWNKKMINDIPNGKFWIISAGIKNRYGFPSRNVIGDVLKAGKTCLWVNEMNYVTLTTSLTKMVI